MKFWTLMQKWRFNPIPLSSKMAEEIELPTLAASTPFPKLSARIYRELGDKDVA